MDAEKLNNWILPKISSPNEKYVKCESLDPKDFFYSDAEVNNRLKKKEDEGYQQGFNKGQEVGLENIKKDNVSKLKVIDNILNLFDNKVVELKQTLETQILEVVEKMVYEIVRHEVTVSKDSIINIIKDSLASFPKYTDNIKIYLNPEDFKEIKKHIELEKVTLVESSDIKVGGCKLESETATVDATIDNRIEKIIKSLG